MPAPDSRYVTLAATALDATASYDSRYVTLDMGGLPPASGAITAVGVASATTFGSHTIYNKTRYQALPGISSSTAFGTANPYLKTRYVYVTSPPSPGAFGTANPYLQTRYIYTGGIGVPSGQVSVPGDVVLLNRSLAPTGFAVTHVVPQPAVGFYIRDISHEGRGVAPGVVPNPMIDFRERTIYPPFLFALFWGDATIAKVEILPDGLPNPTVFGTARVEHHTRYLYQEPQVWPNLFGTPTALNVNRYIPFDGIQAIEFGDTTIYNLLQIVYELPYEVNSPPNFFGDFAWVENRNRTTVPNNWTSSAFGRRTETFVENGARAIYPVGFDAISWGDSFTSHWIRTLSLSGWDSFISRHWHNAYNAAVVAAPLSIPRSDSVPLGTEIVNRNRTVRQTYGAVPMSSYGTAFVSLANRELTHYAAYPGTVSYFGSPSIYFAARIIEAGEYIIRDHYGVYRPLGVFGATVVTGPFIKTLRPNHSIGPPPDLIGSPEIANRNRTLRPRSLTERDDFGPFMAIENFVREIYPPSITPPTVGWTVVQDRRQYATMPSVLSFVLPTSHQVRNLLPDPPSTQLIFPDSTFFYGIGVSHYHTIRTPTLHPLGFLTFVAGRPSVRSTTLQVTKGIIDLDQLGAPQVLGPQYINLDGLAPTSDGAFPKCRLTPHTIYAPSGDQATGQARANHPVFPQPNPITPPLPLGRPVVALKDRIISMNYIGYPVPGLARYGTLRIDLHRRYVAQSPFKSLRFGLATILGTVQTIEVRPYSQTTAFGNAVFTRPPENPRYLTVPSIAGAMGTPRVENWIRDLFPTGIPIKTVSSGRPWVSVNPRVFQMVGINEFGSGTVSRVEHKIRTVYTLGHNSESFATIDFQSFRDRMRVTQKYPVFVASIGVQSVVGIPSITHWVRTIIGRSFDPDAPGRPRVLGTAAVLPSGWESTVFGDIDEWEAGKIKAYGSDVGGIGYPRIAYPILTAGFEGVVGDARVAQIAYLTGIPPISIAAGPSLTDQFGCSLRVVAPLPVLAQSTPSPVVT